MSTAAVAAVELKTPGDAQNPKKAATAMVALRVHLGPRRCGETPGGVAEAAAFR
jgi:hypothetical protein